MTQRVDKCKWYWSRSTPGFYETMCGWMGTLYRHDKKPHSCEKCKRPAEHLICELAVSEADVPGLGVFPETLSFHADGDCVSGK